MKNKKRFWVIFSCVTVLIILTGVILYFTMPFTSPRLMTGAISLSRPESVIRRDMLRITPLGTSKEEVIGVIMERGWRVRFIRDTSGYFMNRGRVSDGPSPLMYATGESIEIGTQSIRIFLGRFHAFGFIGVYVDVYFAFDEDSKLIDVAIRRSMDLP